MMNGLLHAHSGLRWIILIGLIITVITSIQGLTGQKEFTDKNRKLSLIGFIGSHIQLLIGLSLMFMSSKVNVERMMKTDVLRFFTLEHPFAMVIAIVLITLGYMKAKRGSDSRSKFKSLAVYYGIALLIILISIPWPFREALGGSWG